MKRESSILTRRNLLRGAGTILAAMGVPRWASAQQASPPQNRSSTDVMDELSNYMAHAKSRILPPDVAEKAKEHVLDTLAAMVSGTELPPGKVALNFARFHGGERIATVVGSDLLCGPAEAAFVNGMLAHSDETDDSHSPSHSHPGCAVVPAALATGEFFGIDGRHFLRAITLGYDIGTRVSMTLGGLQFQIKTHRSSHSIANTFWRGGGGRLFRRLGGSTDALADGLRSATGIRHSSVAAGYAPCGEVVRVWGSACTQRR